MCAVCSLSVAEDRELPQERGCCRIAAAVELITLVGCYNDYVDHTAVLSGWRREDDPPAGVRQYLNAADIHERR